MVIASWRSIMKDQLSFIYIVYLILFDTFRSPKQKSQKMDISPTTGYEVKTELPYIPVEAMLLPADRSQAKMFGRVLKHFPACLLSACFTHTGYKITELTKPFGFYSIIRYRLSRCHMNYFKILP